LRLLAATNRKLIEEVANGRFRPDLFYRLAVAVLQLPPLRERPGDLGLLTDRLLEQINVESAQEPGFSRKKLSASARNLLLQHYWPGNVRELFNTLLRAAIWSSGPTIGRNDIAGAMLPVSPAQSSEILNKPLGEGLNLPEIISTVARHYLSRALEEARGNKTRAAEFVGLPSYQTLTNWLRRYGIKP
jgi:DNA-binding NtrC family response regulator